MASKAVIALVSLLIVSSAAQADGGYPIRGFIVDSTSAEPLPLANVVLEGTMRGASTNLDGYFVIEHLQPGVYELQVSYLGYHDRRLQVDVADRVMEPLRIGLLPGAITPVKDILRRWGFTRFNFRVLTPACGEMMAATSSRAASTTTASPPTIGWTSRRRTNTISLVCQRGSY